MKNKFSRKAFFALLFISILFQGTILAQPTLQNLPNIIRHYDSLFWQAYNNCDLPNQEKYLTDDLEFYHDKGGLARGKKETMENIRKNLCSNPNFRLRREAVSGTTEVFPLTKNDTIYGAIFSGDHLFYAIENNNPPRLTGRAKFTHVWLLQNNTWKMARILSYDHGAASQPVQKVAIQVPAATLDLYVGKYTAPQNGQITIQKETDHLLLLVGDQRFEIFPESVNKFFTKDRDLVFEFTKGADGKIAKMIVWENGKNVEEAIREGDKVK
jgi:hypothetical protein